MNVPDANVAGLVLPSHIPGAITREVALELGRVHVILCARPEDDAALLQPAFVLGSAILRNARANERSDERSCGATGACAGDSARDRAGDDQAETRNGNRRGRRDQGTERRTDADTNSPADTGAFGRLGAVLEFLPRLDVTEMAFARLIRHDHADVVRLVPVTCRQILVGLAG